MNKHEFPARFRFLPIKNPCKSVSFYTDKKENKIFLQWHPVDSTSEIKGQELNKFKSDTEKLLETYFSVYVSSFSNNKSLREKSNTMDTLTCSYWENWGPLIPSRTNSLNLIELLFMGFWYYMVLFFWNEASDLGFLPIQKLLTTIEMQKLIESRDHSTKLEPSPKPKYWYPFIDFAEDKPLVWIPLSSKKLIESEFILLFKHPTEAELIGLESGVKNQIDWVKENILQNVADYIGRQKLSFGASIKGKEMHFTGNTTNLFLVFLMNEVIVTKQREIEFCKCGCGKPIPPGRRSYATDKCDQNTPKKKIANWLGTRKNRGQLSYEGYVSLMDEVDDLILDGKSEQEIREIIKSKVDGLKTI